MEEEVRVNLVNLTPHRLTIFVDEEKVEIEPSGRVARISTRSEKVGEVVYEGKRIPIVTTVFGKPEGIPEQKPGTFYVVSTLVAQNADRGDVLAPDTSPESVVRDEEGRIVGVRRLQTFHPGLLRKKLEEIMGG